MVPFEGWEMPLQYQGLIQEHLAVREQVGVFDVSHMGRVCVEGPQAEAFLDFIATNTIAGKKEGTAVYTVLCNEKGGSIDDVIIYRLNAERFFLVVNAGNRLKDVRHLQKQAARFDVEISPRYDEEGILAVQGPQSLVLLQKLFPEVETLSFMRVTTSTFQGQKLFLARTGYTGEAGAELFVPHNLLPALWERLLQEGAQPIGLAARDTLRLEMGFALYGHELSDDIAPIESVSAWTVKMNKEKFLGKEALLTRQKRYPLAMILQEKGVPREGYSVFYQGEKIGCVTSGTHSPCLKQGIALALVHRPLEVDDEVHIQVRHRQLAARVCALPFYKI